MIGRNRSHIIDDRQPDKSQEKLRKQVKNWNAERKNLKK